MIGTIFRLMRVGIVLAQFDMLAPPELAGRLPLVGKIVGAIARFGRSPAEGDTADRLARALEQLGPAWIKFGQFLATRPDIIGVQYAQGLARLKDKIAPFDIVIAEQILRESFGAEAKILFQPLEAPIAAASMAQVHKMTLPDGQVRAVKILRPKIEKQIKSELKVLRAIAHMIEFFSKKSRRLKPVAFVDTVGDALTKELDLRREAGAGDALREIASHSQYFFVPAIDWDRSAQKVLTTHWVDAMPMTRPEVFDGIDRKAVAVKLMRGFLSCALDYGFFHADLHEGNLMLARNSDIWAIDFGIMGRLGMKERRFLAEMIYAFIKRDYRRGSEIHFEIGYVPKTQDVGEFAHALRAIGEPIWGRAAKDVSMGRLLLLLLDTTEHFGMSMRPELVLLQKTMVQVEGVARNLDPDLDIWSTSAPIVEAFVAKHLGPEGMAKQFAEDAKLIFASLKRLPDIIDRFDGMTKAGAKK